jgi:hypothetical protein
MVSISSSERSLDSMTKKKTKPARKRQEPPKTRPYQ